MKKFQVGLTIKIMGDVLFVGDLKLYCLVKVIITLYSSVNFQLIYFEAGRELIFFLSQHEVFVELKRNNVSDSKQLNKVMQKRGSGLLKPICMEVIYL